MPAGGIYAAFGDRSLMDRTPTVEQQAIVDRARAGDSFKVAAFAGTGKTTTLRMIAESMSERRILYVAFNRSVVLEAQGKRWFDYHVAVRTAHSLAYSHTGTRFKVDRARINTRQALIDRSAAAIKPACDAGLPVDAAASAALETVARFCLSADREVYAAHVPDELREGPARKSGLVEAIVDAARRTWLVLIDARREVPVWDDIYLKVFQLEAPSLPYDTILFDEAQDANPAMLAIVTSQESTQRIFVGDRHQAIYQWRDAINAMEEVDAPELALTQSFRFGEALADLASQILRGLKGEQRRIRGLPSRVTSIVALREDPVDAVLARTNIGTMEDALGALRNGKRVAIAGGAQNVSGSLRAAWNLWHGRPPRHSEFQFFRHWDDLRSYIEHAGPAAVRYRPYVRAIERYGNEIPQICRELDVGTVEETARPDVVCSTVHKAKGKEWPRVRLAGDFSMQKPDKNDEEANIAYVAITRAINRLDLNGYGNVLQGSIEGFRLPVTPSPPTLHRPASRTVTSPDREGPSPEAAAVVFARHLGRAEDAGFLREVAAWCKKHRESSLVHIVSRQHSAAPTEQFVQEADVQEVLLALQEGRPARRGKLSPDVRSG